MSDRKSGLTLVEVLVVLAVVLLLAMIFLPGGISRETAHRTACLSNMQQLGQATSLYIQDYDGTLPWNPAPGGLRASPSVCAAQPTTSFVTLLQPYLRHPRESLRCPSYPGYPAARHLGYAKSLDPAVANQIGYGFNARLIGSPCRPRTLASLKADPAELVLFGEAEQPWAGPPGVWAQEDGVWADHWSVDPASPERHEDGRNFLFANGRARFLRPLLQRGDPDGQHARSGYYPKARLE